MKRCLVLFVILLVTGIVIPDTWEVVDTSLGLGVGTSMVADGEGNLYVSHFNEGVPTINAIDSRLVGDTWHFITSPICAPTILVPLKLGIDYLADEPGEYLYTMYPVGAGGLEVQNNQWNFVSNPWLAFWASSPTVTAYKYQIATHPLSREVFIAHNLDATGTIRIFGDMYMAGLPIDLETGGIVLDFVICPDPTTSGAFYVAVMDLTGYLGVNYYDGASFFVYGLPDVGSANNISMAVADDGTLYVLAEYGAAEDLIFVKRPGIIGWEYFSYSSTSTEGSVYIDSNNRVVVGYNDSVLNKLIVKRSTAPYFWGIDPTFEYLGSPEGISYGLTRDITFVEPTPNELYVGITDNLDGYHPVVRKWNEQATLVAHEAPPVPVDFIFSAYPNPFNSTLRIDVSSGAEVDIFNTMGQKVGTPIDGLWTPLYDIPSGIYLVRCEYNGRITQKRVVYMK